MDQVFGKYVLLQLPGWLLAALILWLAHVRANVPASAAIALLAAWMAKDLLLFPTMRRFYVSEPAERRIVRERGTAVTALTPDGFVRVHGELWQARSDTQLEEGAPVRVRDIQGLLLLVSPD